MLEIFHNIEFDYLVSLKNPGGGEQVGGVTDETRWPSVGNC